MARVSTVVGTHTHVQTADEQIFPGGTAYLTTPASPARTTAFLGREMSRSFERSTPTPRRNSASPTGRILLQGALIEIDNATGRALSIRRISEPLPKTL